MRGRDGNYLDGETALITELWTKGDSASQIARQVNAKFGQGRSRNAIIGKAHRLGLTSNGPKHTTASKPSRAPAAPRPPKPPKPPQLRLVSPEAPAPVVQVVEPPRKLGGTWPVTDTAKPTLKLAAHDCKFPVGAATGMDQLHCGAHAGVDIYCAEHRLVTGGKKVDPLIRKNGRLPLWARS